MAQRLLVAVGVVVGTLLLFGSARAAPGPSWQGLTNPPPFNPGAMFLLTDGTVMVQDLGPTTVGSRNWWRLAPDSSGSYADGTWSRLASLPAGYAPYDFASAVLPDGRLAVAGGEYNNDVRADSNRSAIYDPQQNTWTTISPPAGGAGEWAHIGDAPAVVLADGRWMVGATPSASADDDAILDPATLTWTTTGGKGRVDANSEAAFTLLPSGKVLSVDVKNKACTTRTTELFDPATLVWSSAGTTPTPLVACGDVSEIGPQVQMYGGQVFVEGATSATALYDPIGGTWSSGPDFPVIDGQQVNALDTGSALLPDGDVLVSTRTGVFLPPTHFLLFDGTSFTRAPDTTTSADGGLGYMLVLPTGQVLYNGPAKLEIFTDPGSPNPAWAPQVTAVPTQLAAGSTYMLAGLQLNGLSEGAVYGDDYQSSSDYPLVQITNDGTGAVAYARTWGMTNRSIAPRAPSCTSFMLPSGIKTGPSELRVVANGIASSPTHVTVGSGGGPSDACPSYALSVTKAGSGSGAVRSSPAGIHCGATCSHDYANGTIVRLTAHASAGSAFAGWSGACTGKAGCMVAMTSARSVEASFIRACVVPKVTGKRLKVARRAIKAHGCRVGEIEHAFSVKVTRGHVTSQKPRPGRRLRRGSKVSLVVSRGRRP
jgi:PASTA domain/Divergent InlB B-repeat domain/Galactose oxidase, central domain